MIYTENTLVYVDDEYLTIDEIEEKYGKVSFGYTERVDNKYRIFVITKELEPQYLKIELQIQNKDFLGTNTTMDIKYFPEVV